MRRPVSYARGYVPVWMLPCCRGTGRSLCQTHYCKVLYNVYKLVNQRWNVYILYPFLVAYILCSYTETSQLRMCMWHCCLCFRCLQTSVTFTALVLLLNYTYYIYRRQQCVCVCSDSDLCDMLDHTDNRRPCLHDQPKRTLVIRSCRSHQYENTSLSLIFICDFRNSVRVPCV